MAGSTSSNGAGSEPSRSSQAAVEQPFHEAGAAALAAVPTVAEPADRARELAASVNLRDLSSVSPRIQAGRVYRSSQVVSTRELEQLPVGAVLDLRQPPVRCKTEGASMALTLRRTFDNCLSWLGSRLGSMWGRAPAGTGGSAVAVGAPPAPPPPTCPRCTSEVCQAYGVPARVYHVDLLPTSVSLRILWEMPRAIKAKVLWAAARRKHPEPIVAGAVADPAVMGYLKLYNILLENAQGRLADAMRLCADRGNLPLLVHCIHGKDRTGLVAMLLLLLCGVERQAVVHDYALSEVLLRESREKRELLGLQEHLTTDQVIAAAAQVMESTISHIETKYGSALKYLRMIGLTPAELAAIVDNLTQPHLYLPAVAAAPAGAAACRKHQD